MRARTVIASETNALDDWEFAESGAVIAPGGNAVAKWLSAALAEADRKVSDPINHDDYGWSFEVSRNGERFWLLLAGGPSDKTMYLWVKGTASVIRLLFPRRASWRNDLVTQVFGLLNDDPRFQNVRIETPLK